VFEPAALVAVNETVYVPDAAYACVGFSAADVAPSPKFQDQEVGEFVDASVNCTACPGIGLVGMKEKLATGAVPEFVIRNTPRP